MRTLFFSVLLGIGFLSLSFSPQGAKTLTLQAALKQELISIDKVVSEQGGTDVRISLQNLHKRKDLNIQISSGVQFASRDTSEQDVIILEERVLFVKAASKASLRLKGYCTQASNRSPGKGSGFSLKENANEDLLKLAGFLKEQKIKDEYIHQHAVWVLTNDHDLKGLHHEDMEKAIALQKFVSDLTGKPMPKYTVRYDDGRVGEVAFTGIVVLIYGNFEYDLEKDCIMTLEVYNEAGEMVQTVFKDMKQRRGHSKFNFKLKARDLPKGKYTSKLFKDGELFKTMEVEV